MGSVVGVVGNAVGDTVGDAVFTHLLCTHSSPLQQSAAFVHGASSRPLQHSLFMHSRLPQQSLLWVQLCVA